MTQQANVISISPVTSNTFTYTWDEAGIASAKAQFASAKAQLGDLAAHSICHFVNHHNVDMLNHMAYFVSNMPKGKSSSDTDKKIRSVALWVSKQGIHTKVDGAYQGKIKNKMAKRELGRIYDKVGGLTPMTKLTAIYAELVYLGEIVEKDDSAESEKTDDQKAADKAVPKSNKAMGKLSEPVQTLLKALYKAAYHSDWVGTGSF